MFGFGKKPAKAPLAKRKNKIEYLPTIIDVGRTSVELTFSDKSKFKTVIYGEFSQYTNSGHDALEDSVYHRNPEEPVISEGTVTNSLSSAQSFIKHLSEPIANFTDDPRSPTIAKIGSVKSAKILGTSRFDEIVQVAKIVPNDGVK